jgi:GH25 family lysozyme M1 (1,4-beta-N-acetylmuramidase)
LGVSIGRPMMAVLHGIDVSQHQGHIDWATVAARAPELRFVMARMSHGGHGDDDLRTDRKAIHNRDGMRSAFPKTPRGFYHFLGTSSPRLQAQRFHEVVGELRPGEFLMLDVEPDEPAKVPVLPADQILATLEAIEDRFGLTPWLYVGLPYLPNAADPRLFRFPLHFPHYHPNDEQRARGDAESKMKRPMMIWQWGGGKEGARVQGIPPRDKNTDPQPPRIDSNKIIDEAGFLATLRPERTSGSSASPAAAAAKVVWNPTAAAVAGVDQAPPTADVLAGRVNEWAAISILKAFQKQNRLPVTGGWNQAVGEKINEII